MRRKCVRALGLVLMALGGLCAVSGGCCAVLAALGKLDFSVRGQRLFSLIVFLIDFLAGIWLISLGFRLWKKDSSEYRPEPKAEPELKAEPEPKPVVAAAARPEPKAENPKNQHYYSMDIKPPQALGIEANGMVPYDILLARAAALFLHDRGYEMSFTCIGGGADEVSHTGAVAYGATYRHLDGIVENCEKDYLQAEKEASAEYGSWFSALNYHYIRQEFRKEGMTVLLDWGAGVSIGWEAEPGCEDMECLHALKAYLLK